MKWRDRTAVLNAKTKTRARTQKAKRLKPGRIDPSKTAPLARSWEAELKRRFARLKTAVVTLVLGEDAFGLKPADGGIDQFLEEPHPVANLFGFGKRSPPAAAPVLGGACHSGQTAKQTHCVPRSRAAPAGSPPPSSTNPHARYGLPADPSQPSPHIHSPQFKAWFGDWESDPTHSSKVVNSQTGEPQPTAGSRLSKVTDSAGRPIPVFHGTAHGEFHEFRKDRIARPDELYFGPGFYFTEDVEAAKVFAEGGHSSQAKVGGAAPRPTVMAYHLNIRKPFDADRDTISSTDLPETHRAALRQSVVSHAFHSGGKDEALDAGRAFDRGQKFTYKELNKDHSVPTSVINVALQAKGHDGITVQSAKVGPMDNNRFWIAFEPTQIKSTQNRGTFDPTDPDVRNVFCATGEKGGVDPSCKKGEGGGSRADHIADLNHRVDLYLRMGGITDSHVVAGTKRDFARVFERMPSGALENVHETLARIRFLPSQEQITEAFEGFAGKRTATDAAGLVAGFYRFSERALYLRPAGYNNQAHYAHELGHVVDVIPRSKGGDGHRTYSQGPKWGQAYVDEILDTGKPSKYATTNPAEGFAEFHRLLVSNPKKAERNFPKCYAVFQGHGLTANVTANVGLELDDGGNLKEIYSRPVYANDLMGDVFTHFSVENIDIVDNQRWRFLGLLSKVEQFASWLVGQIRTEIIPEIASWGRYIRQAFTRGAGSAYDEVAKPTKRALAKGAGSPNFQRVIDQAKGTRDQFVQDLIARNPAVAERVQFVTARSYTDIKGVTDAMSLQMGRVLAEGLAAGKAPAVVARELTKVIDGIGLARATTIARTELTRANAEGQLSAFEAMNVPEVGTKVEWLAGAGACPLCRAHNGLIYTLAQARGKIPHHANCFPSPKVGIYTVGGWRPIGSIEVGDLVLTHKGRFRPVTQLHRNIGPATLIRFRIDWGGTPHEIVVTDNHPVLVNKVWTPAGDIQVGDKVRWMASECLGCGTTIPFGLKYCNQKCQWRDARHRANVSEKVSAANLRQYASGERDTKSATAAANQKVRNMAARGEFHGGGAVGEANGSKQPLARLKIKISKMGDRNPMRKYPEMAQKVARRLNQFLADNPDKHPNAVLARKARSGDVSGMTGIERRMADALTRAGVAAEYSYRVGRLWIDFAIPDYKIGIECDGEQWHKDKKKDAARDARLTAKGWMILRFSGKRIYHDADGCVAAVVRLLKNHSGEYRFSDFEVVKVESWHRCSLPLYNLSVKEDESYIAKGCVVHNCRCAWTPAVDVTPRKGQPTGNRLRAPEIDLDVLPTAVVNANPRGCNQYTGPGCATATALGPPTIISRRTDRGYGDASARVFGRVVPVEELVGMTGAVGGVKVKVESFEGEELRAHVVGEGYNLEARFFKDGRGRRVAELENMRVHETGTGLGARIFTNQVEALRGAGFHHIELLAAGPEGGYVGYKVWPKIGSDGPLTPFHRDRIAAADAGGRFKDARTIQELYSVPGGREMWERVGNSIDLSFDLAPGSRSSMILDLYNERKRRAG